MRHVSICIEYAGLTLPVVKNEAGVEHVPLKPISETFGLHWATQHAKMQEEWKSEFLGVCVLDTPYAGEQKRQMVCIRLDRVAAYLMSLNPVKIRAAGNESGAAFLKSKITEWADAIHDYESFGSAHNPRHADARLALQRTGMLLKALRQRANTRNPSDRALIDATITRLAAESGLSVEGAMEPAPHSGDLFESGN